MKTWLKTHLFEILDVLKFIGIVVLVLMFIRFNTVVADNARTARENTTATRAVVQSQNAILKAIRDAEQDNQLNSEQKTNLIICMLQVPVSDRTTDTLSNCRRQTDPPTASPTTSQPNPTKSKPSQSSNGSQTTASPTPKPSTSPSPSPCVKVLFICL